MITESKSIKTVAAKHIAGMLERFPDLRHWVTFFKNESLVTLLVFDLDLKPDEFVCIMRLDDINLGKLFLLDRGMEASYGTMNTVEHDAYMLSDRMPASWEAVESEAE